MALLNKKTKLKKELSLLHIYTIATGATIASGFFLLPGLAFAMTGPDLVFSYLIAVIPVIPALFSMSELSTAMPRAGGIYFFLDRSMGPLMGTIGGLGAWLALILKTSFALVGIGAYAGLFFPDLSMLPIAIAFAIFFGIVNLLGAKKSGNFQTVLVIIILGILLWFSTAGIFSINSTHFSQLFKSGYGSILNTAGLVYVSYVGLSKIASISEEVKSPEKNLPLGMFLALITAVFFYIVGTVVIVGVVPAEILSNNLTPVATAADFFLGKWGSILVTIAAIFAFLSVANVGILSSSRYPLAMSRDHLMPPIFRKLTNSKTPINSIIITVAIIIIILITFDITKIAKLAGAFQLILFSLCSLAVIVMRESKIDSYDPGFKSPFYPWLQIIGIISPFWLIVEMGWLPSIFSVGLLGIGSFWYFYYARSKVIRDGAIYHIFARLGEQRFEGLDSELRGILKEKGLRDQDPFDAVVASAIIIDIKNKVSFEDVVTKASDKLSDIVNVSADLLKKSFLEGTLVGATPVANNAALPHLRLPDLKHSEMIMVRTKHGVTVNVDQTISEAQPVSNKIHAFFFLVSPESNPGQHLRILAQIASHVDDSRFIIHWLESDNEQDMKELLLRDDRFIRLSLKKNTNAETLIGQQINQSDLPEGCLIALIHRRGEIIVPKGNIILEENDHLTIIGYPDGIKLLYERFELNTE